MSISNAWCNVRARGTCDCVAQGTRLEALHWVNVLLQRSRTAVMAHHETLLPALFDALNAPSDRVVEEAVAVQVILRKVLGHAMVLCPPAAAPRGCWSSSRVVWTLPLLLWTCG